MIELFVAHHCPSCPDARRRVDEFADAFPKVTVVERNVDEAQDAAVAVGYGLFATPAIVIGAASARANLSNFARSPRSQRSMSTRRPI